MPKPDAKDATGVIRKVALAVFKDKKILQVRTSKNDHVFYAPGGKIEEGETDIECLKREIREELDANIDDKSVSFLHEFTGPAHGKPGTLLNIKFYQGNLIGEPKPTSEIVEIGFFDSESDLKHISEIGRTQFFPWLKKHGYIN